MNVVIPISKLRDYLLDLNHPIGGPKAKFFIGRGFSQQQPEVLAEALRLHFEGNVPSSTTENRLGDKTIVVDALMTFPDNRSQNIRSVW